MKFHHYSELATPGGGCNLSHSTPTTTLLTEFFDNLRYRIVDISCTPTVLVYGGKLGPAAEILGAFFPQDRRHCNWTEAGKSSAGRPVQAALCPLTAMSCAWGRDDAWHITNALNSVYSDRYPPMHRIIAVFQINPARTRKAFSWAHISAKAQPFPFTTKHTQLCMTRPLPNCNTV